RLDTFGDSIFIEAFHEIRQEPKTVIIQKCLIEITQIDREVNEKVLDFLVNNKNGSELEFLFLKTIIYHFFDTKTKKEFDNLEISIMQSRLNVKDYGNYDYVSISGQVKFSDKNYKIEDTDDNILSTLYGS